MKGQNRVGRVPSHGSGIALSFALCGLVIAVAGLAPATLGAESRGQVVVSLSQLNNEIVVLRNGLGNTMAALEELKAAAAKDSELTKPFTSFSDSYASLEAQTAKLREQGTALKARAQEHWTAWQTELSSMQNAKLREKAQSRYSATVKEFQKITEKVDTAKSTFAPLMADLKDVNTYLKTDLSKDAVSSLSGTIWKMGNAARSSESKLADVNEQIERVLKKMPEK
jgi:uncharacterized coiled-coil DUF342 family protein